MKKFSRLLLVTLCFAVLAGCANRFFYNTLPFWINYYASDYVDLTSEQEEQFEKNLRTLHAWHKTSELPQIKTLLLQIDKKIDTPLTMAQLKSLDLKIKARVSDLFKQLTPSMSEIVATLSDEQIDTWLNEVDKKIKQYEIKQKKLTLAERKEERLKKTEERLIFWVDEVTPTQKILLEGWVEYRMTIQPIFNVMRLETRQAFADMLKARKEKNFEAKLEQFLARFLTLKHPRYHKDLLIYKQKAMQLVLNIQHSLTSSQRRYLKDKLDSYITDINKITAK